MDSSIFLFGILTICIIVVTVALLNSNIPVGTETRKELCILEKELKYPTAENYTINRLCYLEELGRAK